MADLPKTIQLPKSTGSETSLPDRVAPPALRFDLQGIDYAPSVKDTLVVAWIRSHFECAASRKGAVVSEIIVHSDCASSDAFEQQLDAAIEKLGFKGATAELLIDGGLLESTNVTLPPVSNRQQAAFVREKVKRLQADQGSLVWESQRIAAVKAGQRVLVHNISKIAFNELDQQFARRDLDLKKVLPFLGTAGKPFKDIQTPPDSASIVLAPVGSTYKILAIDHAGDIQFARDLNKENGTDPHRVAVEINRCILFTRQQFGKPVSQIVTVGLQAARFKAVIRNQLQGEIPIIHRSVNKDLWLSQLCGSHAFNLAKESVLQDRKRRLRKILSSSLSLFACSGMLAFAYQTDMQHQSASRHMAGLEQREEAMSAVVLEAERHEREAERLNAFIDATRAIGRPPVEQALLNFLAAQLPSDTWVSELEVRWNPNESAWTIRLLLLCDADASAAERRRENLQAALRDSAFAMRFSETALDRVRKVSVRNSGSSLETISLEGTIVAAGGASHAL